MRLYRRPSYIVVRGNTISGAFPENGFQVANAHLAGHATLTPTAAKAEENALGHLAAI
jgi:hypothetical protein